MDKLVVRGTEINVQWDLKRDDFLSLTDIAKIKDSDNPRYIIQNWLRNRNTIEFLGVWETLYNPNFNRVEFDAFSGRAEQLCDDATEMGRCDWCHRHCFQGWPLWRNLRA